MYKILKKYFSFIFILIFILIFSLFNKEEYLNNYENNTQQKESLEKLDKSLSNFDLSKIRNLEKIDFYYTPYKDLLDKIVWKIDNSKNRVYIEVYMLTEKRIQKALVNAKNNWVDVKVILEKNPYKAASINNKSFDYLNKSWVSVTWSNPDNFSLNHSKFVIIDNEIIVSSWNLTYSSFAYNRDLFLFIKDDTLLEKLEKLFIWDFKWNNIVVYDDNLILSPNYSRHKIEKIFYWASESIDMYFQYLSDDKMLSLLKQKAKNNIKIRLVVAKDYYKDNLEEIKKLEENWIQIRYLEKIKMHSKAILIDDKYLFIWSINFSKYSFDENRELWILLKETKIINKFKELFYRDFN